MPEPRLQGIVGFVRVVGGDFVAQKWWVLHDLRNGCIDLCVCRGGRVISRGSPFFAIRLYSEIAGKGRL